MIFLKHKIQLWHVAQKKNGKFQGRLQSSKLYNIYFILENLEINEIKQTCCFQYPILRLPTFSMAALTWGCLYASM